jgi:hypothetical protein
MEDAASSVELTSDDVEGIFFLFFGRRLRAIFIYHRTRVVGLHQDNKEKCLFRFRNNGNHKKRKIRFECLGFLFLIKNKIIIITRRSSLMRKALAKQDGIRGPLLS